MCNSHRFTYAPDLFVGYISVLKALYLLCIQKGMSFWKRRAWNCSYFRWKGYRPRGNNRGCKGLCCCQSARKNWLHFALKQVCQLFSVQSIALCWSGFPTVFFPSILEFSKIPWKFLSFLGTKLAVMGKSGRAWVESRVPVLVWLDLKKESEALSESPLCDTKRPLNHPPPLKKLNHGEKYSCCQAMCGGVNFNHFPAAPSYL